MQKHAVWHGGLASALYVVARLAQPAVLSLSPLLAQQQSRLAASGVQAPVPGEEHAKVSMPDQRTDIAAAGTVFQAQLGHHTV